MADHALHPQQRSTQGEHDDGHVRPATQTRVEQDDDGQTHHGDEASTGLQFSIHFYVDALAQQQRDGRAVVGAEVAFEVHVGPFRGATGTFGLKFKAGLFGVLRRVEDQGTVGQAVPADPKPFFGELNLLFLMCVFPNDFPTHLLEFRAVQLHQQPRRRTGPSALAPQRTFPGAVGQQLSINGPFLMSGVVRLETAVQRQPAQEVVVGCFRHAGSSHVDVGLGDVRIVKFQAVKRETIRPVRGRLGDHAQRREARLGEDGGVVHEAAEVVGERDGTVGLVAGHVVHQGFECRRERVVQHEVQFGVQFPKDRQVQNASGGRVDTAPWLTSRHHF